MRALLSFAVGIVAGIVTGFIGYGLYLGLRRLVSLDPSEATCHVCGSIEQRGDMHPIADQGVTYLLCRRCSRQES